MSRWKKSVTIAVLLATGFSYLATGDLISAKGEVSPIQTIAFAEWQLFSPKEERFSILMPIGKIERDLVGNGSKKDFTVQTEEEGFSVILLDMPTEQVGNEANILANIAAAKAPSDYRFISQRKFGLNGNPGIEVNYVSKSDPKIKITMRYIFVQKTVYVLVAVSDSPTRAQTFLNSFRIIR